MDDNLPSDDEMKDSPMSPKLGGKKLKLNDGSSQDSLNEGASGSKDIQDENVDSGVSADKSESPSEVNSEERAVSSNMEPTNEVVNAAPSSSNVRAILLDLRRPRHCRIYRKRKTPDRDSDENSSRDSDDLSNDERSDNIQLFNTYYESAPGSSINSSPSISSSDSSESSNNDYSEDHTLDLELEEDGDSEDTVFLENEQTSSRNKQDTATPPVLLKTKPKHNYVILREVINREMGLTFPLGKAIKEDVMFEKKFYGSLHAVYRMAKFDSLMKHRGCVNSINFHPEGHLLASGSDDTNVIVWDWARNIPIQTVKTGHKSNVFQSKFLYLNAQTQLNIVTCARDGQVRLIQCPASGMSGASRRKLANHARAAHKVHVSAHEPHLVISAGEDAVVMRCDVREEHGSKLFQVRETTPIPLYSVAGHPLKPEQLLVAGRDMYLRVYDTRKTDKPLNFYTANFTPKSGSVHKSMMHLTCAVYNHDGSEILGSYNDEDIYLFDTKLDVYDKDATDIDKQTYTHKYSGHRNSATFKGVAFFGPQSQYIVSGSDCAHIYIWEKQSEAIVQWMDGDNSGVVNCIEPHPRFPIIASSGLDKDVKIWMPCRQSDPDFKGMEKVVRENSVTRPSQMFTDFLPTLYSAWRETLTDEDSPAYGTNIDFDGNACTTF
ncbi:DDB1- and CUL4-associated factor 8 [Pieris napi]|uniref:DDB1- and CUL4-associated factor 8 n=1 Tax=Pieris napi TaxID=78633 RepID=UPI001FBBC26A|nr:DDB1- and CUL4-associated factor 8 [Pieris napi]